MTGIATFGQTGNVEKVSARSILDAVLSHMPQDELLITARFRTRPKAPLNREDTMDLARERRPSHLLNVEVFLHLGAQPPEASYTIRDAFGALLERLTVVRETGKDARYVYAKGDPLSEHMLQDLFTPIQTSDVQWSDLALTFLWWKNSNLMDDDKIKGFECFVIEVHPPRKERQKTIRLWIAKEHLVLLRAEEYDTSGKRLRRLSIKSFKKINDQWMIKDLEVQTFPSRYRTILHVNNVRKISDSP